MDVTSYEKMTDDQLLDHINQLTGKLGMIRRLPSGSGAVEQLTHLLNSARAHYNDRLAAMSFKQLIASRPAEINSDPSLNPVKEVGNTKAKIKPSVNRVQVRRSSTPVSQIDLSPSPPKDDKK